VRYDFSEPVRHVLFLASEVARELRHDYVGTEHILLALLQQEGGSALVILAQLGVDPVRLRKHVLEHTRPGRTPDLRGARPYTSRAKRALEYAMASARDSDGDARGRIGRTGLDTHHLLQGLIREAKGIAAQALVAFKVTDAAVAETARRFRARPEAQPQGRRPDGGKEPRPPAETVWFLQVEPSSATPIYEQIVARIEEAVATGRLTPGERLPAVRELAAELEVAPGTVARAYGALEQRGVLETRGARGTHVALRPPQPPGNPNLQPALSDLLRPVAVAAYHMGARAQDVRDALETAMGDIFP